MIIDYLKTKKPYLDPLYGVRQLATDFNMTASQLRYALKKETKFPPKRVLDIFRMAEARRLMQLKSIVFNTSTSSLSGLCGYSRRSFLNSFKRLTGMSFFEYCEKLNV